MHSHTPRLRRPVAWIVTGLALLVAAPAAAQSQSLSLSVTMPRSGAEPRSRADFRSKLASDASITYSGKETIQVTLLTSVYDRGQFVKQVESRPITVRPGDRIPLGADNLPPEDWFPTSGTNLTATGSGYWFDGVPILGWLFGPSEPETTPTRPPSGGAGCGLPQSDPSVYAGCSFEECQALAQPFRSQCHGANRFDLKADVPNLGNSSTIAFTLVPATETPNREPVRNAGFVVQLGNR